MPHASPVPSSKLHLLARLARWALGLTLAAWFIFGSAWAALHWLIVPRIGELRPWLEARATRVLGVPVRIESIAAKSSGMMPSFELTNIELVDAQGRVALRLPRVLAALSPRSVLRLGFEQLYLDSPQLDIRRDKGGRFWVAGLDLSGSAQAGEDATDWFFSQIEFAIHDGSILWTDEMRGAPALALGAVDLVVRNDLRRHNLRLDATPPAAWGERFSLRGMFAQPLLSRHSGRWQEWDGQVYAEFARVDLSELRRHASLGVDLHEGSGALTAWVDVRRAQVQGAVADLALGAVSVTLGTGLRALELESVRGRLGAQMLASGFAFSTQSLAFDTRDGLRWPGGNFNVRYLGAEGRVAASGEIKADRLDLAALSQIANRLPIDQTLRTLLSSHAPKGLVERVEARWQGPTQAPVSYDVKGVVRGLELDSASGLPGVAGARIDFDFNQGGGRASVDVAEGQLTLPDVFEEARVPVTQLSGEVRWQINGERIALQMPNLKFSNADAQGQAQVKWETSDPAKSATHSRFPGVLDLQGTLSRANGTRVYRYLPLVIHKPVRDYVRDAVQAGSVSAARFKVRGDLHNMPFTDPKLGEFRIAADVQSANYAYVPRTLQPREALPWPVLTQLSGELVFERAQMRVKGARTLIGTGTNLQGSNVEALIADLKQPVVTVQAQLRGPLGEALAVVRGSPIDALTAHALARASGSGAAQYKLALTLPIASLDQSLVRGSVLLSGNDVQMTPETPRLGRARGSVNFSESGFSIVGGQARILGGEARIEGGTVATPGAASPLIRVNGSVSAEGLRQARELGFVARLARGASGTASYAAVLGFRRGEPELSVTSTLQGLALGLPAPLNKSAESSLGLRLETALVREPQPSAPGAVARLRDQFNLELGRVLSIAYLRDLSSGEPRVLRGTVAVGLAPQESVALPEEGVAANINVNGFDVDAWGDLLSQAAGTPLGVLSTSNAALSYLPSTVAVRASELTFGGRMLHNLVVGGSREGMLWRANLDATELNGYLQYRPSLDASAGRVYARLSRLTMEPKAASEVEALLSEQPASIPALDIVVEDFELRGKRLGRVEIEAVNRSAGLEAQGGGAREWRLNKFNMITPEATLSATGNWARVDAQAPASAPRGPIERRRTALKFKLDVADSGELLARLGMNGVVRKGRGKLEGQVAWLGSPLSLDYASMSGAFAVNVESGQFLKADPGIAKLLGVLSLQSLPRRLTLDFRDVFSDGFAFDFLRGDVGIEQGIARTNNLQMKGVNAAVLMEGQADIARETQDVKVVVVPEINAGTASLIATVINPAIGLGTFLAQLFLRRPLTEAATQEFHIDGSWADPRIAKVERKSAAAQGKPDAVALPAGEAAR